MRSERIIFAVMVAILMAACSQSSPPPESHAEPTKLQPKADEDHVPTTTGHVSADQLRQAFMSGNMAQVGSYVSAMLGSDDAEALSYLQAVWALDPKVMGELNEGFVKSDSVRAYTANVLAQMVGNRMINIDLGPLREALRAGLLVSDRDVKIRSADGLSYIAEPADADRFVALAEGADVPMAKVAVAALANTCGQYASEKLDGVVTQAKNQDVKQIAESMRSQLKDTTAARCAGK